MKVKKGEQLIYYKAKVLGLKSKDKIALLDGKEVEVKDDIIKKYPSAFSKVKEVKHGNK